VFRSPRARRPRSPPRTAHGARKVYPRHLLNKADDDRLRYSQEFDEPTKLLAAADQMGLEGIVSKRADQPLRSGKNPGWIKVKGENGPVARSEPRPLGDV
jgi:ATP-dependent DNA ligase